MRVRKRRYSSNKSFLDLLFNTLVGFVLLFTFSFLLIAPISKKDIKVKAEFIITMTWQSDSSDDVDVWLEDPLGNILFFKQKEIGLMHLDKDDLGHQNDTVTMPNGEVVTIKINQEVVTIRGFIPGEWVLNIHMYNKRDAGTVTNVEVRLDKLNPSVKTIIYKNVQLIRNWQEETVTRFTMAADGEILSMDDMPKKLVRDDIPMSTGGGP